MKRIVFGVLAILIIAGTSCNKSSVSDIPKDCYQPDSLVVILTEIHKYDALLGQKNSLIVEKNYNRTLLYNSLWKKHKTTYKKFQTSMDWYAGYPKLLNSIYDQVLGNLQNQKQAIKTEIK